MVSEWVLLSRAILFMSFPTISMIAGTLCAGQSVQQTTVVVRQIYDTACTGMSDLKLTAVSSQTLETVAIFARIFDHNPVEKTYRA